MSSRGIQARSERVYGGDTVNRGFPFKTYKSRRVSTKGAEMRGEKENLLWATGRIFVVRENYECRRICRISQDLIGGRDQLRALRLRSADLIALCQRDGAFHFDNLTRREIFDPLCGFPILNNY